MSHSMTPYHRPLRRERLLNLAEFRTPKATGDSDSATVVEPPAAATEALIESPSTELLDETAVAV